MTSSFPALVRANTLNKAEMIEKALLQGKTYKEIANEYRVSFRDISKVAKALGQPSASQVFDMFAEELTPMEVWEALKADRSRIIELYKEWVECHELMKKYNESITGKKKLEGSEFYKGWKERRRSEGGLPRPIPRLAEAKDEDEVVETKREDWKEYYGEQYKSGR